MCSFEPSFGAPLAWTSYTYGNYYNISYQNSNSSPTINQPLQNFSFVYGSTPNIGYNNNCPANTSANLTFQGSGFSINYGGTYTPFWEVLVPGYVNPKYVVVGVVYAPPGSNSYASYTNSSLVSSTMDITKTFSSSDTVSVSVTKKGSLFGFLKGSQTASYSNTLTQQNQDSKSVTLSYTDTATLTLYGPGAGTNNTCYVPGGDYLGVDHDCDVIKVWVNPVQTVTLTSSGPTSTGVQWNGYGYSELDTTAPIHIVDVLAGCLNGDFSPSNSMCSAALGELQRTWASGEIWPSGQGPGLTQSDLSSVLAADPWGSCTPSSPIGSSACPTYSSPGFVLLSPQFTLSDQENIAYQQGSPQEAWTVSTTNTTTQGQESKTTNSQTFAIEDAWEATIFKLALTGTVKKSQTLEWSNEVNNSTTVSNTFTGTAFISGPACNGIPCNPSYPPAGPKYGQATEIDIFVDNFFGSFVFVPSAYN